MSTHPVRILVVDDDKAFRVATGALLKDEGYEVRAVSSGREALDVLGTERFDILLSDLVMEEMSGLELLRAVKEGFPRLTVIMVTGFGSIRTAVEAMHLGAHDYLTKPCNNDELVIKVARAVGDREKTSEIERLRSLLDEETDFANIVSQNDRMKKVFKQVRQVSDTDVTVLVLGETGTGKELLAKAIHVNSPRRSQPFLPVQCSALPESLLESELFGHERGAFTGAQGLRPGKFEEADGGTVFLDEIGDIPLNLQTKLLRVLQEKQVTRLGSNAPKDLDVRIIAATNQDLEPMVAGGLFREDLFYRVNVFPVTLPPLRDRLDDIPLLAEHLLKKHRSLSRNELKGFSPSCIHDMMNYSWRGNIRELENLIKRAIITAEGGVITRLDLPGATGKERPGVESPLTTSIPYKTYVDQVLRDAERKYLMRMLEESHGNMNEVARKMDVDRKTIYRKISEFGIDVQVFKA
ncbi:MAG TPA: sigma-54 dependent transcriptional regulator [Bacteroidota bacterium]|nr:sigma-54 dependent transcriptional regulator [Bacteroidota bacterium]